MTSLPRSRRFELFALALTVTACLILSACGDTGKAATAAVSKLDIAKDTGPVTVRLGYFPNVTHAPAIVGVENGTFAKALGDNKLETKTFNAGPEEIEAVFAGALDIGYIGPNPAINAWQKSQADGGLIRIISGSTSGGASLVVKADITSADQLEGKSLASPQLGNAQDVALRTWLKSKGLRTDTSGGGDVSIKPQANADTLTAFKSGAIDGAWVPEPWATRLVQEGGGKVLVDESTLWPEGKFVTTTIIVRAAFLDEHPDVVAKFLQGHLDVLASIESDPAGAQAATNAGIAKITGKPLADKVIAESWKHLSFSYEPLASAIAKVAGDATELGLLKKVDLNGVYDLRILDELLAKAGKPAVSST